MTGAAGETQPFRTRDGGRIDRARLVRFTFDGAELTGHPGDTLASALIANGVHLVGRSFKYHRPRGILAAGSEEPNALVTVTRDAGRTTPNLCATQVELYDGLVAMSQNRWPSLSRDVGAINDHLAPLLPAGFYYKTFMGPRLIGANRLWPTLFEPLIRRAAGLGRAPQAADPDRYASRYAHCDVLVIGAGAAGLAAAKAASACGALVILCDEQAEPGGGLLSETEAMIEGRPAALWIGETLQDLQRRGVRVLRRTTAFGAYAQGFVGLAERLSDHLAAPDPKLPRERLWQVRAGATVLATGALERPMMFADNDRPGVMLAGAAATYAARYGARPGTRVAIAAADDSAYRAAIALDQAGVKVVAIVDRRAGPLSAAMAATQSRSMRIARDSVVVGTRGRLRVTGATLARQMADGDLRPTERLDVDLVLMAGGWTPAVHLFTHARGTLTWDAATRSFQAAGGVAGWHLAGACRGVSGIAEVTADGFRAGESAARGGHTAPRASARRDDDRGAEAPELAILPGQAGRAFVDYQNDVTAKDLRLAVREGFRSIEHVKRYTTTGMASDQGKTSNMNALSIAAGAMGKSMPAVGLTTFRPPYTPVTFGTLAGKSRGSLLDPIRRTAIDGWARAQGAIFEDVGLWQRARSFPRAGEDLHAAVARECRTVRTSVGVFDGSTLGKIEVVGPDAQAFLNLMYATPLAKLAVGRCRYVLQLNEAGFIIDDGIVARLGADRFHVTTTTGGAARVLNQMEDYLQTEFPHLRCWLTSITENWSVIAVQGPRSREVIAPFAAEIDLANDKLPHMSVAEGRILGVPMRLFRVSFTGELGYEINVAPAYARAVWEAVHARAAGLGGCAYGTEAMHVLRAEKGYIIVGQETDGTVIPRDLGFGEAQANRDFVGKRSLARPDMGAADRPQLVGLQTADPAVVLEEGAQVTRVADPATGTSAEGHVTSAYMSPVLGRSIALALVKGGQRRHGERLFVPMADRAIAVTIVPPVFYDVKAERLDA